jgi:hypothetical protein
MSAALGNYYGGFDIFQFYWFVLMICLVGMFFLLVWFVGLVCFSVQFAVIYVYHEDSWVYSLWTVTVIGFVAAVDSDKITVNKQQIMMLKIEKWEWK